jgi:hypothetical protein
LSSTSSATGWFGLVGVQQCFRRPAADLCGQFPAEVEIWSDLFDRAPIPNGLVDSGLDRIGASKTQVWAEISAAMPDGAVCRLLDWMKETVDQINTARESLAVDHARVQEQANRWWTQGIPQGGQVPEPS